MKMVRNGRLRKLHRSEWPHFLNRLAPPSLWQQFLAQMPRSTDARTRWSPKSTLLCWVMLGWSLQTQLTQRFQEARQTLTRAYYRRRRCGETYQGLVQATRRFGPELFTRFWAALRSTIPRRVGSAWTWAGWTVFAVDGSRIQAPRTRANERSLRRSGRSKSHPQWWITRLIHLPTRMMWDWRQGPGNSSEREHLRSMYAPRGVRVVRGDQQLRVGRRPGIAHYGLCVGLRAQSPRLPRVERRPLRNLRSVSRVHLSAYGHGLRAVCSGRRAGVSHLPRGDVLQSREPPALVLPALNGSPRVYRSVRSVRSRT